MCIVSYLAKNMEGGFIPISKLLDEVCYICWQDYLQFEAHVKAYITKIQFWTTETETKSNKSNFVIPEENPTLNIIPLIWHGENFMAHLIEGISSSTWVFLIISILNLQAPQHDAL